MLGLTVAAALGIAACGSDNNDKQSSAPATQAAPESTATTAPAAGGKGTTLAIAADPGGKLAFDKKALQAKAGKVTIDLTNRAQTPHNVVIEKGEKEAGATATITGSRTSKTFDLKPGKYTFYCSVDGHRQAGMQGTLTVR